MAVGFIPKHIEEFQFSELTREEALALLIKTSEKLSWQVTYASRGGIMAHTNAGMFKWNGEITIKLGDGTMQIKSASAGNDMVDWGKNKKTVHAFTAKFTELKTTYSKEELHTEYLLIEDQLTPDTEDELTLPPAGKAQQFKDFMSIFKPVKGFFITPILMDLNILIFILMVVSGVGIFSPDNEGLISWGANFKPITLAGEWWRLITSCFVHIGIIHVLFNMYALLYIGVLLEPILGPSKFLIAYLLTGLTASMTSLWWHDLTISAGASGAIFGMYGVFLALLTTKLIDENSRKSLLTSIAIFVGYNLMFGMSAGVDNAAHIGGLAGGFVIGYGLIPGLIKADHKVINYGSLVVLSLAIIALSAFAFTKIPNDIGAYDTKMQEFSARENQALTVFTVPEGMPTDTLLNNIQKKGLDNWKENTRIIEGLQQLNLPNEYEDKMRLMKEYCKLRITECEIYYKKIAGNTTAFDAGLDSSYTQIERLVKEINSK